jgi:hypothetical protein
MTRELPPTNQYHEKFPAQRAMDWQHECSEARVAGMRAVWGDDMNKPEGFLGEVWQNGYDNDVKRLKHQMQYDNNILARATARSVLVAANEIQD